MLIVLIWLVCWESCIRLVVFKYEGPQNHLKYLLKHRVLTPFQNFWFCSSRIRSENFPGGVDIVGPIKFRFGKKRKKVKPLTQLRCYHLRQAPRRNCRGSRSWERGDMGMPRQMGGSQEGRGRKIKIKTQQTHVLSKTNLAMTSDLFPGDFLGSCFYKPSLNTDCGQS